jgi:hypothetical protein
MGKRLSEAEVARNERDGFLIPVCLTPPEKWLNTDALNRAGYPH